MTDIHQDDKGVGEDTGRLDCAWRRWASLAVGAALILAALFGFVVLPLAQGTPIGLSAWNAICRALGVAPSTPAILTPPSEATAQPVSEVAWSPQVLQALGAGRPEAGAAVAEMCAGCHGEAGLSEDPSFPNLAGQSALALYKQMHDFRSGSRASDIMGPVAEGLDDQMILDLSSYYAHLARGTLDPDIARPGDAATAQLINRGAPERGIPACVSCHGTRSGGPMETPTIAGQKADYLAAQLHAYADGSRRNDVYGRMRAIAGALTPDEIDRIAAYYASTPPR